MLVVLVGRGWGWGCARVARVGAWGVLGERSGPGWGVICGGGASGAVLGAWGVYGASGGPLDTAGRLGRWWAPGACLVAPREVGRAMGPPLAQSAATPPPRGRWG